ncbi:hypothetical protein N9M10_02560 [Hellea sp.]|nr:hypothetical protein [Hellea sp.]
MEFEQKILENIGKILWSIFPEDAVQINFIFQLFKQHRGDMVSLKLKDGSEGYLDELPPYEAVNEIFELIIELQNSPLFQKEKFTHGTISITDTKKIFTKFAYVAEEDNWPYLFMRGVSELSKDEINKYYIPEKTWNERVAKRPKKKSFDL